MWQLIQTINGFLWTYGIVVLLIAVGVLYTVLLKFPQIRFFKNIFSSVLGSEKRKKEGINAYKTMCTVIGGQVGTGNLAGVATAIASGGPGAVFWMWVIGFIGMATNMAEAILAQIYHEKTPEGHRIGGPTYYLSNGVGGKFGKALGVMISISMIIASGFVVAPLQINSIVDGFAGVIDVSPMVLGITFAALTALVVFGGISRITTVASVIVPFMSILYVAVALFGVIVNITAIPSVLALIVKSAFGVQAAAGGVIGYTVRDAFRYGCARGMFSNEAGEGTTPAVHASAEVDHPVEQGFAGMFSVFVDTIVVCSCTCFLILFTGAYESDLTGISLTQSAVNTLLGGIGPYFILVCIIFFAFTSCYANIYYGETSLRWLNMNSKSLLFAYRLIAILLLVWGAFCPADLMWEVNDFVISFLVLPNGIGLLAMSPIVVRAVNDYVSQKKAGIAEPKWDFSSKP